MQSCVIIYKMNYKPEFPDSILNNEGGMFQMEITNTIGEAKDLIEISTINEEIKEKTRVILQKLITNAETQIDKVGPYDLCRNTIAQLLNLLDQNDNEQRQLFENVRDVILKARNSVYGWENK